FSVTYLLIALVKSLAIRIALQCTLRAQQKLPVKG
ncbi:MAG: hypothetical protein ACI90V_004423, partial [Bacillariaceae sp.]